MIVGNFSAWLLGLSPSHRNEQSPLIVEQPRIHDAVFDWDKTTPNASFVWHPCFGDFQCARLQVPMDWHGKSRDKEKTVEIAVVKLAATVPITDATYGGAVVFNPGGPGGSGVGLVLEGGKHFRTVLSAGPDNDSSTAQHFDIIGFDPRGVNNTTPTLSCFPDHIASAAWTIEQKAYGNIDSSDVAYDNIWASQRALADGCSKRLKDEGIAKHMSTAPVARDIIEIFERHGQWRETESRRLISEANTISTSEKTAILERTAYRRNEEKVQYWGFSYGTILGAHLSAMFPDRIRRAVLDGVSDSFDYMAGRWSTNLRDTDQIFIKLTDYCWQGGPGNCPIYDEDGPAVIAANIQATLAHFAKNPISVPGNSTSGPEVVTYADLSDVIHDMAYAPIMHFTHTAQILYEIGRRNGSTLAAWKKQARPKLDVRLSEDCVEAGPFSRACIKGLASLYQGQVGIACTDGLSRVNETKEQYKEYADAITAQSFLLGAHWAREQLPCTAWHIRPDWRYEGNFRAETAHPILLIGNTIDPVTPLYNAYLMAKGFKGAGVLQQDSEGHCSTSSPSMCTGRALRAYFQTGELPEHATQSSRKAAVCEPNRLPLDGYDQEHEPMIPEGETDVELWKALVGLNRAMT